MRVVVDGIIYQLQPTGGISRIFSEILPRMCNLDPSLRINLFTEGRLLQEVPRHTLITHRRIPSVSVGRGLLRLLSIGGGKGKIWHPTYYSMPESWKGQTVITVADLIYELFPDLFSGPDCDRFREQRRRCISRAEAVICISDATREDLLRIFGIDPGSVHVVPLACSDIFRETVKADDDLKLPTKRPFFLYVGTRSHYKNFDLLLDSYGAWEGRNETDLVVVGPAWSESEIRRLAALGLRHKVHLLTGAGDMDLCRLYNRAAALVYPSRYEGFGIPLLEAMACGCPVIASRIPSTVEVGGGCPLLFDPARPEELLMAFDQILSEGRGSVRTRAGLLRSRSYSWERTAEGTLEVYRSFFPEHADTAQI